MALVSRSTGPGAYLNEIALNVHRFGPLVLEEHELFKRLFKATTGDESGEKPIDG